MNTITPLSAIPGLGSSTSGKGGQGQEQHSQQSTEKLLTAKVIELKSDNRFVLDFNGNQIVATSKAPLSLGQTLNLQVVSTTPRVELSIVSDVFTALSGKPLVLLGSNIDITSLLGLLQHSKSGTPSPLSNTSLRTLETFLPSDIRTILSSKDGGEFIQKLFNRLGVNLEALLARGERNLASQTLKAALLEVLVKFNRAEQITEQAGRLLATLDLYQHVQVQLNQHNLLIFPLPLPFFEQGYLLLENYQEGTSDDEDNENTHQLHYALHLTMSGLGNMKIEFLHSDEGLYIKFFLDSKEKTEFVSQFTDLLSESISEINVISVSYSKEVESPAAELLKKITPIGESFVNTTA